MLRQMLFLMGIATTLAACVIPTGLLPSVSGPPRLTEDNISLASPDLRVWGVESTSAIREGSTTTSEQGSVNVEWSNGATTTHDATYKSTSGTLFQDGKVCHNYGPTCYCGTTTFRLESGSKMWHFGTPSNNVAVECPRGVEPTGDPEIKKSMSKEELDALKKKILRERRGSGGK